MAYYVRDGEIVPVAVPLGKRVKIGSSYVAPLDNHIANDQLWIQDVFTFNQIPWYAIKNRLEKWLVMAVLWGSCFYILTFIGRYLGAKPGWF
jgi:hypothetical protein